MFDYYRDTLAADRLERVYAIAPPRVRQYLRSEIEHVLSRVRPGDVVLELGCGYGRVIEALARRTKCAIGVDTSLESLRYGRARLAHLSTCHLAAMDAARLGFEDGAFDCVVCVQNGISAFHTGEMELVRESVRVARAGGLVLFSSYSGAFWEHRLEWFKRQAEEGLIGEVDDGKTRGGVIVCKDGFTAATVGPERFADLARELGVEARIAEVDGSSVFCEMVAGDSRGTR